MKPCELSYKVNGELYPAKIVTEVRYDALNFEMSYIEDVVGYYIVRSLKCPIALVEVVCDE